MQLWIACFDMIKMLNWKKAYIMKKTIKINFLLIEVNEKNNSLKI